LPNLPRSGAKAPEDWRTPKRFAQTGNRKEFRASVLDCGGPPPFLKLWAGFFLALRANNFGGSSSALSGEAKTVTPARRALVWLLKALASEQICE
jgi:hypothetical protein